MILPNIGFPGTPQLDLGPGMVGNPNDLLQQAFLQELINRHGITALMANPELATQALATRGTESPAEGVEFPLARPEQDPRANLFSALTQAGGGLLAAPTGQFTQGLGAAFRGFGGTLNDLDQKDRTSAIAEERNDIYRESNAAQKLARAKTVENDQARAEAALLKAQTEAAELERDAVEVSRLVEIVEPMRAVLKIPEGVVLGELPKAQLEKYVDAIGDSGLRPAAATPAEKETPDEKQSRRDLVAAEKLLNERIDEAFEKHMKQFDSITPEQERAIRDALRAQILAADPQFGILSGTDGRPPLGSFS